MTTTKARKGRVTVTPDTAAIVQAKDAAGRSVIEIIGPPFGASVHEPLTGTDRHIPADEAAGIPGSRMFIAWLLDLVEEYDAQIVVFAASAVRHAVEQTSLDALKAGLKPLTAAGIGVYVNTAAVAQQPVPTPRALPPLGEEVASGFARGEVRGVAAGAHVPSLLARLGRSALLIFWSGPDRLVARQHGSPQHFVYRITDPAGPPAAEWFRDLLLACGSTLVLIEQDAIDRAAHRGTVDLTDLAREHRIAVGVLPNPTTTT